MEASFLQIREIHLTNINRGILRINDALQRTIGLAQAGFIAASAVTFGIAADVYPFLSSRREAVSYYLLVALLGASVAGYAIGCRLFARHAIMDDNPVRSPSSAGQ